MKRTAATLAGLLFATAAEAQQVPNPIPFNEYKGITTSQIATGVLPPLTPVVLNKFLITSDDAAISTDLVAWASAPPVSGPFHNALLIEHNFGGPNTTGGTNSLHSQLMFNAATSPSNPNRNYAALAGIATVLTGDGGTNALGWAEPGGDSKGGFFGLWANVTIKAAVQNITAVEAAELNIGVEAGATGWLKEILVLAPETVDAAEFTHNFMLTFSSKSPHRTFDSAISFNNFHGSIPLKATGALMSADGHSTTPMVLQTGRAFDFRKMDFIDHMIEWCDSSSGSPLTCNSTSWIDSRKSKMKLVHNVERSSTVGDPTHTGDVRFISQSETTGNALSNGGMEWKVADVEAGFGYRILPYGETGGNLVWALQRRYNAAAWTTSWSIINDFITHSDPTNFDAIATFNDQAVHHAGATFNDVVGFNAGVGFLGNVATGPLTTVGIQGTLGVIGSATFAGPVSLNGNVILAAQADFTGTGAHFGATTNVNITGPLGITGPEVNVGVSTPVGFAGNIGVGGSALFNGPVSVNNGLTLLPIPAPGSPGSGWILYTDSGDGGKLKAKAAGSGTVVVIGTP